MTYSTILTVQTLRQHLYDPRWAFFDCRFSLADKQLGRRSYLEGHIPGAVYADLEVDLSGPVIEGVTGRHPLPDIEKLEKKFSRWGIDDQIQVVVYDDQSGAFAARMWWLLRWTGHRAVAVLEGGWQAWVDQRYPTTAGMEDREPRDYRVRLNQEMVLTSQELLESLDNSALLLIDARDRERYLGEEEPIDPVAGHIPGALSSPYKSNLDAAGRFKSPADLRSHYLQLAGSRGMQQSVVYCGSGVTAAHNILAMEAAGLPTARLYAGSWSEWITDSNRPIQRGVEGGADV